MSKVSGVRSRTPPIERMNPRSRGVRLDHQEEYGIAGMRMIGWPRRLVYGEIVSSRTKISRI